MRAQSLDLLSEIRSGNIRLRVGTAECRDKICKVPVELIAYGALA
jgi:hypothetical protein